jgi:hypothetical protein
MTDGMWSPLSDTDPVPGDPFRVNNLANHFAQQAEAILDMVKALKEVRADDIKSVYVDSLTERRDEVVPDLKLLAERYRSSGEALRPYARALEHAQELAEKAKNDSWDAQRRITDAQRAIAAANPAVISPSGAAVIAPQVSIAGPVIGPPGPDHEAELRQAKADLDRAESLLDEAKELRDRAARKARDLLDDANHDDLKNPNRGFFSSPIGGIVDSIKNLPKNVVTLSNAAAAGVAAIADNPVDALGGALVGVAKWTLDSFSSLEAFSSHLGLIGGALGIAALFFPPTSLIAGIGFAISATKLATDTYLAATGRASWGDVTMSAIGVAAFGATRVAASVQRARALEGARAEIGKLNLLARSLPDGLDAAQATRLVRAQKVTDILTKQANARNAIHPIARFANIAKDPGVPAKALMAFSPGAQKIGYIHTVVKAYDAVDTPLGRAGTVGGWADELKPLTQDSVP